MQWLINLFFKALEAVMVLCMVCMMVMVFGNVIMRYGFHSGFPVSDELSRFCFFWVIFLGAIVASRNQKHLSVDTVQALLPKSSRKVCWGVSQLLVFVCCVLMFYGFWLQHDIFSDDPAPVSEIPLLMVYGVIYLSSACMGIICLNNIVRLLMGRVDEAEYSMAVRNK